jgi:putative membrane protein
MHTDPARGEPEPPQKEAANTSPDANLPADPDEKDYTTKRELPLLFGKSFVLGAADVVPGVSGGTMALILGIYKRMLDAIKSVNGTAVRSLLQLRFSGFFRQVHWKFGLTLLTGIFCALIFFTRVVPLPVFMYSDPELIYGLFFGLILGSVVLLTLNLGRISLRSFLAIAVGTLIGFWVVNLVPTDTPDHPLFLFATGSMSISALVLPGISGSFILLILRKYDTVLGSIGLLGTAQTLDALIILVPFGFGVVFGLAIFSRILSWLLKKYYLVTLCVLIGFMAGSLYIIWPFQDREFYESERPQIVNADSFLAREAALSSPTQRAPGYLVLGDVINPEAPESEQQVEVIVVQNKLISSTPFIPLLSKADSDARLSGGRESVWWGLAMILAGLAAVLALGWVSYRKQASRPGRPSIV